MARTIRRRVDDAERRLRRLEDDRIAKPPPPLSFTGVFAPEGAGAVLVRDLVVPGRLRLDRLEVSPGGRLLVTGANGSGKSTLLKRVAGRLSRTSQQQVAGMVDVRARRIGYLAQDVRLRRPGATAAAVYAAACTGNDAPELRRLGLLHPRDVHRPVGELSVGQQRRLALAVLVAQRPDLMLLDEPTNDISLALAEELEDALQRSVGTRSWSPRTTGGCAGTGPATSSPSAPHGKGALPTTCEPWGVNVCRHPLGNRQVSPSAW